MRLLPVSLVSLLLASGLMAQYAPPIDPNTMLANLRDLKEKQTKAAKSQLSQTIGDFSAAAASDGAAADFYSEAVRVTQFVGQNREQTSFHDWKKKESDKLNGTAIRTCLRYMVLSVQRAAGATDAQIFPGLYAYAGDTEELLPTINDQEIVHQPINRNIFARWYALGDQLSGLDNWEPSPANVDNIYTQFLLPYMRKTKDRRIIDYWDRKISTEASQASSSASSFSGDSFNQTRRPDLMWSRAEDMVAIGLRAQGLTEMYSIIKNNPAHPNAGKWIDELEGLLTPAPAPAASAAAPAAASSGAAAVPAPAQ